MEALIAVAVLLLLSGLMICVLLKRKRHLGIGPNDVILLMLGLNLFFVISGLVVDSSSGPMLTFNLIYSLVFASMSVFQVFENIEVKFVILFSLGGILVFAALHSMRSSIGILSPLSDSDLVCISLALTIVYSFVLVVKTLRRLLDIKTLMNLGAVWSYIWICSDCVYLIITASIVMFLLLLSDVFDRYSGLHVAFVNVFLGITLCGMYLRKIRNSPFIFRLKYEKTLIESIKVVNLEVSETSLSDDAGYRVVYDRIKDYFEHERPFLRSDLTINDLVSEIYSNKLYISRAISLCTGRNFRQFVNYYRIQYSCEMFRRHPTMKIVELSQACGFNTVASFNMAFRLFMNETPGEWCRKEKVKILSTNVGDDVVIDFLSESDVSK